MRAKRALVTIARRWSALDAEIRELDRAIKTILDTIAAPLLARHGVGYETVGALLCTAGDNPDRLATEASFAVAVRHRTRADLHRQLEPHDDSTAPVTATPTPRSGPSSWSASAAATHRPIAYLERRIAEGHSKRDAIRCLKRFVAREIYADIQAITTAHPHDQPLEIAA